MLFLAGDSGSITLCVEGSSDGEYDSGNLELDCSNLVGDRDGD